MARRQFALAIHTLVMLARSTDSTTSSALAGSINADATGLRRMLSVLGQAGLVQASEGRDGGYRLAMPAHAISLADIYSALAKEPLLNSYRYGEEAHCPISAAMGPALSKIVADAEARFQEELGKKSLAEIAGQVDSVASWLH